MGLAVPHVHMAVRTRAVNVGWGWLYMHALSCGSSLQVCAQQWQLEATWGL